jgi:hypothetical protein
MAPGRIQCRRTTCPRTSRRTLETAQGSPPLSARQIPPRCCDGHDWSLPRPLRRSGAGVGLLRDLLTSRAGAADLVTKCRSSRSRMLPTPSGRTSIVLHASDDSELDLAFATLVQREARDLAIGIDASEINGPVWSASGRGTTGALRSSRTDRGAQVLPPAGATVPPWLPAKSAHVSNLPACCALGPPAAGVPTKIGRASAGEHERIVGKLNGRQFLRVHHHLERFNTLNCRGGSRRIGGRGRLCRPACVIELRQLIRSYVPFIVRL